VSVTSPPTQASLQPLGTAFGYDAEGRLTRTQQSVGDLILAASTTAYSPCGKPVRTTDAKGNATTYTYDTVDRLASVRDPLGRVTSYSYDAMSRRTGVFNPAIQAGALLSQGYTPDGLMASLTDANGNGTTFSYDGLDRLSTTTYPGGSTETLTYDANGNVTARNTRAGQTITFTYDTLNRLSSKAPPTPAPVVSYGYDLAGRLIGASDTSSAIAAAVPPSGPTVQYATTASYDAANRPLGFTWTPAPAQSAPSAASVSFSHGYDLPRFLGPIVT
jgi:YD repeat-containing protein